MRAPSFDGPQYVAGGIAAVAWVALALLLASGDHDAMYAHVPGFLGMWTLMVIAMMVPASWAGLRTHGPATVLSVGLAALTNVVVWGAFGLAALAVDRLVPWALLPAVVLVVAGLFQLSPAKRRFLAGARPRLPGGAWRHTVSCVGSCWALMLVMFAIGSLALMVALTVVMVAEQARRGGDRVAVLAGVGLIAGAIPVAAGW